MTEVPGTPQPQAGGEPTPQITLDPEKESLRAELEAARQKATEHEAQKEHWRTKYERDIANPPLTPAPIEDGYSDEGRLLKQQLETVEERMNRIEDGRQLEVLYSQYPALKDSASEFEKFRTEYPRHKLENIARLFLVDWGF